MKKKIGDLTIREAAELVRDCDELGFIYCLTKCRFYDEEKRGCMLESLDAYYFSKIDLDKEIEVDENEEI